MKRTKLITTAQHPEQPLWDDNSERDNPTQMDSQDSIYETEAQPQKQHLLEQLVEFYYEVTSGILSLTMLTDVRSLPLIKEFSDISLYNRYE